MSGIVCNLHTVWKASDLNSLRWRKVATEAMPATTVASATAVAVLAAWLGKEPASPPLAEPSAEQVELYARANEAYDAGDYETAIARLDEAIALGPLNILHLSKARSLQKLGRCVEARDQIELVFVAPQVGEPEPAAVSARGERYLEELRAQCPGWLRTSCADPEALVSIGDDPPVRCEELEVERAAGPVEIVATQGTARQVVEATVTAFETTVVTISLEPSAESTPPDDGPAEPGRRMVLAGQVTLGVGAAGLLAAVLVDTVLGPRRIDAFDRARDRGDADALERQRAARAAQAGAITAYALGGAAAITGAVLWAVGARRGKGSRVSASVGPSGGGIAIRF